MVSGSARPITDGQEKAGTVNTGRTGPPAAPRCGDRPVVAAASTPPASRATGTAYRGANRLASRKAVKVPSTRTGALCRAVKTPVPNANRMPASIAFTIPAGTALISRPNRPVTPNSTTTTPLSTNAPTASRYGYAPRLVTSRAAPGVDQAVTTGVRVHQLSSRAVSPLPIATAQIQDAVCAWSSRPAAAAASTTTSGPENPTTMQISPASRAGRETSRRSERRDPSGSCPASWAMSC